MVPSSEALGYLGHSFPRASGDGPIIHFRGYPYVPFPPRERGWSPL